MKLARAAVGHTESPLFTKYWLRLALSAIELTNLDKTICNSMIKLQVTKRHRKLENVDKEWVVKN